MRSVVVLPQPDGPSRAKNEPWGTSRSSDFTAVKSANCLVRFESRSERDPVPVGGAAASSADGIGEGPPVLAVLLPLERHEGVADRERLLGGEDQLVVDETGVDLLHGFLCAVDRADVPDVRPQLGFLLRL